MHTFRRNTTIITVSTLLMVALTLAWDAQAEPANTSAPSNVSDRDAVHERH